MRRKTVKLIAVSAVCGCIAGAGWVWRDRIFSVTPFALEGMDFGERSELAFKLEQEADLVVSYSSDGMLDIGVGQVVQSGRYSGRYLHLFALNELENFFDAQKHKDLIVVIIDTDVRSPERLQKEIETNVWSKERLQREIERVRDFFAARGYKRISIQQAHGAARRIHLSMSFPTANQS